MLLDSKGIPTITSTSGATTFPNEWIEKFSDVENIYFCFDNDEVGVRSSLKLQERFSLRFPEKSLFHISLPPEMGKDVTEFMQSGGTIEDILTHYSEKREIGRAHV